MPITIRRIAIRNYKGIDELEVRFPPPRMSGDPDILVVGSENGLGKTSLLECCALLLLGASYNVIDNSVLLGNFYPTIDIPDLLLKAGSDGVAIEGDVFVGGEAASVRIEINRSGIMKISNTLPYEMLNSEISADRDRYHNFIYTTRDLLGAICGSPPNPTSCSVFLFFPSYRKVQEGNTKLGTMIEQKRADVPLSTFKLQVLRSLMSKAGLFEFEEEQKPDDTIDKLNEFVRVYAGGTISKLRPSEGNAIDIRIMPASGGESFTFDGLSSGQKEIISTLFLIWHHTRNNPSVVLVDEPELHLNAQWHRSFIKSLVSLAPQNQYIMATHSEDIMDSVDEDRRIFLLGSPGGGK